MNERYEYSNRDSLVRTIVMILGIILPMAVMVWNVCCQVAHRIAEHLR
jgi:hypothetical protein